MNLGAAMTVVLGAARTATVAGRNTDRRMAVRNILAFRAWGGVVERWDGKARVGQSGDDAGNLEVTVKISLEGRIMDGARAKLLRCGVKSRVT